MVDGEVCVSKLNLCYDGSLDILDCPLIQMMSFVMYEIGASCVNYRSSSRSTFRRLLLDVTPCLFSALAVNTR